MWWEKTVEYLFVVTYINRNMLMAPLDGYHEAGGDLITSQDDRFMLIEFKRNLKSVGDEVLKFPEPSLDSLTYAKESLGDRDGHHLLIYGQEDLDRSLELKAISYFRHQGVESDCVLACGIDLDEFNNYLSEFLCLKFGDVEGGGRGRDLNYSVVMAVDSNGEVVRCEGLSNYCDRMGFNVELSEEPTPPQKKHNFEMGGPR